MATSHDVSLKHVPLFKDLSETELNFLLDRAVSLHYAPDQSIFVEGDPCEGLYVVESGHVKIFRVSPNGREQILAIESAGGSVAWKALRSRNAEQIQRSLRYS